MGSYIFSKQKQNQNSQYVTFLHINSNKAYFFDKNMTLKQVKDKLNFHKKYHIYFSWSLLTQTEQLKTLNQIIETENRLYPHNKQKNQNIFLIIDQDQYKITHNNISDQIVQDKFNMLLLKLSHIQQIKQNYGPNYTLNNTGHLLFEGREHALLASAVNYAVDKINSNMEKDKMQQLNKSLIVESQKGVKTINITQKLLYMLGIVKHQTKKQQKILLQQQNSHYYLQNLKQTIASSKQFTDFDPKFIYYITQIYLKFMIQSLGRIHYINYKNFNDFNIASPIKKNSKIGLIGDFGTGLKDSIMLLENMIIKQQVDIVIHLGDVYYAGTPKQYEESIVKPLKQIRLKVKRQVRFYSIPGNHDYYSWGLPFLTFVKNINEEKFQKQNASYFCLRDQQQRWQFLGIDTAYHDSSPINQIDPYNIGPYIRNDQLLYHKHNLQSFPGSSILLTHHQLFSIHQRINGSLTSYRQFSQLNPMLYYQLFEHIPLISGWFWGHEHSFMLFKQNIFGLNKGRLIGNSSYHVIYNKQNPYTRKDKFNKIPLIVDDKQYMEKYVPKNRQNYYQNQEYFALTYAVIDMKRIQQDDSLPIEYWCSPCFDDQQYKQYINNNNNNNNKLFDQYKLYEEVLQSKSRIMKKYVQINNQDKLYLRCQIGLVMKIQGKQGKQGKVQNEQVCFDMYGSELRIQIINSINNNNNLAVNNFSQINFKLKLFNSQQQNSYKYFSINQLNKPFFINIDQSSLITSDQFSKQIWSIKVIKKINPNIFSLTYGDIFQIYHEESKQYLGWKVISNKVYPILEKKEDKSKSMWMFCKESLKYN